MRIRNRIKRMVAVENRYYNREGAISFLIGVSIALICFNLVFAIFYYYGNEQTDSNLQYLRYSAYLLIVYILFLIAYRFAIRYLGYRYPLITGFTAATFLADAGMSYLLFRTVFCWNLNRLIENPLGFEPILRRSFNSAFQFSLFFLLAIVAYSFIPAKRQRPVFFGRFFFLNTVAPLIVIPIVILVIVFIPENVRVEYTRQIATAAFFLFLALSIRYLYKTVLYYVLLADERKIAVDEIKPKALEPVSLKDDVVGEDSAKKELPFAEIVVDNNDFVAKSDVVESIDDISSVEPMTENREEETQGSDKKPKDTKAAAASKKTKTRKSQKNTSDDGAQTLSSEKKETSKKKDKETPKNEPHPKKKSALAKPKDAGKKTRSKKDDGKNKKSAVPEETKQEVPSPHFPSEADSGNTDSAAT